MAAEIETLCKWALLILLTVFFSFLPYDAMLWWNKITFKYFIIWCNISVDGCSMIKKQGPDFVTLRCLGLSLYCLSWESGESLDAQCDWYFQLTMLRGINGVSCIPLCCLKFVYVEAWFSILIFISYQETECMTMFSCSIGWFLSSFRGYEEEHRFIVRTWHFFSPEDLAA